jgi:hypothetical protein
MVYTLILILTLGRQDISTHWVADFPSMQSCSDASRAVLSEFENHRAQNHTQGRLRMSTLCAIAPSAGDDENEAPDVEDGEDE